MPLSSVVCHIYTFYTKTYYTVKSLISCISSITFLKNISTDSIVWDKVGSISLQQEAVEGDVLGNAAGAIAPGLCDEGGQTYHRVGKYPQPMVCLLPATSKAVSVDLVVLWQVLKQHVHDYACSCNHVSIEAL